MVEKFYQTKIKTIYSDCSGEAHNLGYHLSEYDIQHLKSPSHHLNSLVHLNANIVTLLKPHLVSPIMHQCHLVFDLSPIKLLCILSVACPPSCLIFTLRLTNFQQTTKLSQVRCLWLFMPPLALSIHQIVTLLVIPMNIMLILV